MEKLSIFLGGTCGSSTWRNKLLPMLNKYCNAFNPVVENWTEECQAIEDWHKKNDDLNLFVITPESNSTYSLFEIGCEASKHANRTVVCFLNDENGSTFDGQQLKSIKKMTKDLKNMGVAVYDNLDELAADLNRFAEFKANKDCEECK
ncbi:MAG: hypothetical protein J6T39_01175 [Clostridia bacterium]|nr:hypothetical protein [Clostridia bacterium]